MVKLMIGRGAVIYIELIEPQSCCIERLKMKPKTGTAVSMLCDDCMICSFYSTMSDPFYLIRGSSCSTV